VLADGKIFAVSGKELVGFKADEVFTSIGSADLSLDPYCSPTIANGRLLVRTPKNVACYDLNK
jgi:hypothetical protein